MNLKTKSQFAAECGKHPSAISHALRKGKLETFQDTGKINPNSALSQKFKATVGKGQKDLITGITGIDVEIDDDNGDNKDFKKEALEIARAQKQKVIEEGALKAETRKEKQLKNAYRRSEVVLLDAINQSIMMYIDHWYNTNKRVFSASYDEMERKILAAGERQPDLKREFLNKLENAADTAKNECCDRLNEIGKEQAKG